MFMFSVGFTFQLCLNLGNFGAGVGLHFQSLLDTLGLFWWFRQGPGTGKTNHGLGYAPGTTQGSENTISVRSNLCPRSLVDWYKHQVADPKLPPGRISDCHRAGYQTGDSAMKNTRLSSGAWKNSLADWWLPQGGAGIYLYIHIYIYI
jgi:hypothetical protein